MPRHRKLHVEKMPERLPDPWVERQPSLPLPGINQRVTRAGSSSLVALRPPRPLAKARPRPMPTATIHTKPTEPPPASEPYPPLDLLKVF